MTQVREGIRQGEKGRMGMAERGCWRKTNRRVGDTGKGGNKTGREGKDGNGREGILELDKQENR